MIPAGYMLKNVVARPGWLKDDRIQDICSVSECFSKPFADYINYWRHNGYWLFNSPGDIAKICTEQSLEHHGATLFYYEVFEREFNEDTGQWLAFAPESSFATCVQPPVSPRLLGYDVVTFSLGTSPECSPLSCNSIAGSAQVNRHCLFDTFEEAINDVEAGRFRDTEPGPFGIFAVYEIP